MAQKKVTETPTKDQTLTLTKDEFSRLRKVGYALDGLCELCEEDHVHVASILEPIIDKFTDVLWQIESRETAKGGAV